MFIQVQGEISNFVCPSSGHWYFTLKDERAQVRCAMFRNRSQFLNIRPKNGDQVEVRAKVSLYEGRGDFQLICEHMEESGTGALQQAFEALKKQLQYEGLFDQQHKQPLPERPAHIGIITSRTGAAVHDILTVLNRRCPGIPVTIYPAAVQGEEAVPQLCRALQLAQQHGECDALILGRGGGSLEDLWSFNNEQLARAIFNCTIPIVSAVGHEVDVSISDFVADMRAATPSAAAELLSPDYSQQTIRLEQLQLRLKQRMQLQLAAKQQQLRHLRQRLRHPGERLAERAQRLDGLEIRLRQAVKQRLYRDQQQLQHLRERLQQQAPEHKLLQTAAKVEQLKERLQRQINSQLIQSRLKLSAVSGRLNTVSPLATLERGYSITQRPDQSVIHQATELKPGDLIHTRLSSGKVISIVDTIEETS